MGAPPPPPPPPIRAPPTPTGPLPPIRAPPLPIGPLLPLGPPPPPPPTRAPHPPICCFRPTPQIKTSLKTLHWVKVTRALKGSIWKEFQRDGVAHNDFDLSEIEAHFTVPPPVPKPHIRKKHEKVRLIDFNRASNTEIMLTKVKMPLPDMMAAVLAMDDFVLDIDQIDNFIKFCPTKGDMELLKNYTGDTSTLGKCEQIDRKSAINTCSLWEEFPRPGEAQNARASHVSELETLFPAEKAKDEKVGLVPELETLMAMPPPPPPPLPMMLRPAPKKSSLKRLHWVKVPRALEGSIWEELQRHGVAQNAPDFDVAELEALFSATLPKVPKPPENVGMIDFKRAYNTEIMLTKIKMPLPDVMAAVLAIDDSVLDIDQIDNLIKFCPTKKEMELLKNYTGDTVTLGKCEQYFLELMKVPRVESKMRVFAFKIQFGTLITEFKKSLNAVNSACEEVRTSQKLKEIMKKILCLGNTLNQGTVKGAAVGFKLESLSKLSDTRDANSKMTLMHYLCKVLASKASDLLDFHKDLESLESASKIRLRFLAHEMKDIVYGLNNLNWELIYSETDGPVSDVFRQTLKDFITIAETEVETVSSLYSVMEKNADALLYYFGEDPKWCPFEQVTATLFNFIRLFKKAHEENVKQAELEMKKAAKEAIMEKAEGVSLTKNNPADKSGDLGHIVINIDVGRADNIEVMLSKVRKPLPLNHMIAAVLAMDESVLDINQIENLIKFCPTKEEMELLKNYTGDKATLGKSEQYFLMLMKVPRVESKLRVFAFKIQFGTQISEFKRSLNALKSVNEEVRSSQKLKEIMKKILCLGNTMNQGTARGAAVGFKLESLLKLNDTRAANSKMTLMHYLCKVLASKASDLLEFQKDLESLESASKITLKSLAEEMQDIVKGLEKLKQEFTASESDGPVSEVFRKRLKDFISIAATEVETVSSLYAAAGMNADALLYYFGEDPKRCSFEQGTATLLSFIRLFKKAHRENVEHCTVAEKRAIVSPPPPPTGPHLPTEPRPIGPCILGGSPAPKKSPLKRLHWVKLPRASEGSIWEELQRHGIAQNAPDFDVSELETLFSATVPKPPEKVGLLDLKRAIDPRRAINVKVLLSWVKIPLPDMMAAVRAMDESVLDIDQIENLIKFCPTKEEMEFLENYTGDTSTLGMCEQFFLELMKVPRVESKLRVFAFKIQFGTQITELKKSLNAVISACEEVHTSQKLKEITKEILCLENTLNQGTVRGATVVFKLDTLLKLSDTRATNSKMTLMHYLCKVLASKASDLLDFHKDLESLESASKIRLSSLAGEMHAIFKGLEKLSQELTASESDGPVSDVFCKTLKDFITIAETEVETVSSLYSVMEKNADALLYYFGEDPKWCPFEQVTATLFNFIRLFKKAHEENVKQAELEMKKAAKEAIMEKAEGVSLTKNNPADISGGQRKLEKVQLIDVRRADNIEVMLSKVRKPLPLNHMIAAVLAMEESVLDIDQIENRIKFCPTKEEMELLKNYTGDKATLGKSEQYFLELMKVPVPRVESKLRVFAFKIQFGTQISEFKKSLNAVKYVNEEVRSSQKLKEIMKKILCLGNTLNQGTARGAAVGFKLESLLKLNDTRAANSKMTLMHYLCKVLASKASDLLDFHKDLESLESASKITLKSLAEEMQDIVKGLEKLNKEFTASESDGPISEVFRKRLKDFISIAETEVETVSSLYAVVGKYADALLYYFGEDPKPCSFEQVTATLLTFIRLFNKAHRENVEQAELEKAKGVRFQRKKKQVINNS